MNIFIVILFRACQNSSISNASRFLLILKSLLLDKPVDAASETHLRGWKNTRKQSSAWFDQIVLFDFAIILLCFIV